MTNKNTFFSTKAGKMTLAFIVIMLGFALIMFGLNSDTNMFIQLGFILILIAMMYSPIDVFILNKKKK